MKPSKIRLIQVEIVGKMMLEALQQDHLRAYGKFTDWSNALNEIPDSKDDVMANAAIISYDRNREEIVGVLKEQISNINQTLPKAEQFKL